MTDPQPPVATPDPDARRDDPTGDAPVPADDTVLTTGLPESAEPVAVDVGAIRGEFSPVADLGPAEGADDAGADLGATVDATAPAAVPAAAPKLPGARRVRVRQPRTQPPPRQIAAVGPYAVIETGGKQYRVGVGDILQVERIHAEAGSDLTIDRVLLLGGDGATRVGTPVVLGAAVTARVDDHLRGEKIVVFKYKAKKRYRRRTGHRQELTRLTITGIQG